MSGIVVITPPPPPPPPRPASFIGSDEEWAALHAETWKSACRAVASSVSPFVRVKAWWRSRLMWLGAVTTLLGIVLEVLAAEREMALAALGSAAPWIIIGLGIAIKILRWKTSTGIVK